MLVQTATPPRFNLKWNLPLENEINYQFCFLNRPFISENNAKDIYYELLVWPKAPKIIEDFDFLIKIDHQNLLKPLEILEFPKIGEKDFDPLGDSHLTIKIPQTLYQSKMNFALSYQAFTKQNYGKLLLNLELFNPYQLDNQLVFYDSQTSQSTNLLTWNLALISHEITFNATYPHLFSLVVDFKDIINQTVDYESIRKWGFLAKIDEYPQFKNFSIENLVSSKKAYNFEPQFRWLTQKNFDQTSYHLQLNNQLALVGKQIQETSQGPFGFKANPFVTNNQVLNLNFIFLNHDYQFSTIIQQANLIYQGEWSGDYFEI